MAVYITGDIHGMIDDPERFSPWNFPDGIELGKDDYVIILGDFGMPYDMLESDCDLRDLSSSQGRSGSFTDWLIRPVLPAVHGYDGGGANERGEDADDSGH